MPSTLRRLLSLAPLLLLPVSLWCGATAGTLWAEDWPRWGGVRGDDSWQGPKLRESWPAEGLKRLWQRPLGGGYGGVAAVGSRVLVMERQTEPKERERLLCCDAATGQELWLYETAVEYGKLDYGNGPRAMPVIDDNRVYLLGALGHFACLEVETGKLIWKHELRESHGARIPTWGLAASPLIVGNLVIVHPGGTPNACWVAFDKQTGREVWRTGDDPAGYAIPVLIDAPSGPLLIGWSPTHIVGMLPGDGQIVWKIPYEITYGVSIATPIYHENLVFISGYWHGSKAIRLGKQPGDHELAWEENRFLRGLMAQPIFRDGHVYTIDKQFGLTCFALQTAEKKWDCGHRVVERGANPQATLTWLNDTDRALIFNENGDLILARLNPAGYDERARAHLIDRKERSPLWAHPAYAGNRVFVRSDSEFIAYELPVDAAGTGTQ